MLRPLTLKDVWGDDSDRSANYVVVNPQKIAISALLPHTLPSSEVTRRPQKLCQHHRIEGRTNLGPGTAPVRMLLDLGDVSQMGERLSFLERRRQMQPLRAAPRILASPLAANGGQAVAARRRGSARRPAVSSEDTGGDTPTRTLRLLLGFSLTYSLLAKTLTHQIPVPCSQPLSSSPPLSLGSSNAMPTSGSRTSVSSA